MIVTGGHPYQGYSIGILKFDKKLYPMMPGDVGNATSYPFPVLIREIKGLEDNPYPSDIRADGSFGETVELMIEAARQFEKDGVRAIAGCCGFFSLVQPIIATSVNIPVMMSPLMIIPIIHQMLNPKQSVLVVTAAADLLSAPFFSAVNVDRDHRLCVAGLEGSEVFNAMCMGGSGISFEYEALRQDIFTCIAKARDADPTIGAVLLECTTMPPFAEEVRAETGLPVFDFVACVEWMHRAVVPHRYSGFI